MFDVARLGELQKSWAREGIVLDIAGNESSSNRWVTEIRFSSTCSFDNWSENASI